MKATFEVRNTPRDYTIRIRMTGKFDAKAMWKFADDYKRATETYEGKSHLILADMRGMTPLTPEVGHILSEAIAYCRARGVACCAHLSDDTIQRLQAARLARGRNPQDQITVEVVSLAEGERVLGEARAKLRDSMNMRTASNAPSDSPRSTSSVPAHNPNTRPPGSA